MMNINKNNNYNNQSAGQMNNDESRLINTDNISSISAADYQAELKKDPAVEALTSQINVYEPQTVVNFGREATKGINDVSDVILRSIKVSNQEDASQMINQLAGLMKKFNKQEIKEITEEPNFIKKIFKKTKSSIENLLAKYDNMSAEIDKIYMMLKKYQSQIDTDVDTLKNLYNSNLEFYDNLEKHIAAGELGIAELDRDILPKYEQESHKGGTAAADYNMIVQCRTMLEERIYDLRLAENVALQSLTMIQQMQRNNFELSKTINSSFDITLPIFKNALIQAVIAKRQEVVSENLQALRDVTNEMIVRNAQSVANQSVNTAKMAGQGSLDVNKLEEAYNVILNGIEATQKQYAENKNYRTENTKRLESLKGKIKAQNQAATGNSNPYTDSMQNNYNGQNNSRYN